MKKKSIIAQFVLILIMAAGLIISPVIFAKTTVIIGIDSQDSFPSMGVPGTEKNKNPGIFIEEMRYIEKQTNIRVKYKRMPWKRCLINLKSGKIDGVICGSYKKERE